MVVRYVDLMETSIAQSIYKGFEKERWEIKGNGCATSGELFWKLDALQSFIRDLHWPDQEFRQHLEQRLTLMACDMIETCIQRTDAAFQQWLKKGVTFISTDYIIPSEMCAMVNVILDAKNQSFELCTIDGVDVVTSFSLSFDYTLLFIHSLYSRFLFISFQHQYHAKIDDLIEKTSAAMTQGMINKLVTVLETTLSKLSRYDEGSFIGSILSLTVLFSSFGAYLPIEHRLRNFFLEGIGKWERNGTGLRKLHEELHGPDSWQSFGRIVDFNVLRGKKIYSTLFSLCSKRDQLFLSLLNFTFFLF